MTFSVLIEGIRCVKIHSFFSFINKSRQARKIAGEGGVRVGMSSERNETGLNRDRDTQRRYLTRKFEFSDHQEQTIVDVRGILTDSS